MVEHEILTAFDGPTLAEAFTIKNRVSATIAGMDAARRLAPQHRTKRFTVQVGCESILIPVRLHFASERPRLADDAETWLFVRALQTRSNDGFERQRAARDLLGSSNPAVAPFIMALIGEYIIEILNDIATLLTPELEHSLGRLIVDNPVYWNTTKQRVTSYWNVYYRARWLNDQSRAERREEYVGSTLIQQLDAAALRCAPTINE